MEEGKSEKNPIIKYDRVPFANLGIEECAMMVYCDRRDRDDERLYNDKQGYFPSDQLCFVDDIIGLPDIIERLLRKRMMPVAK